MKVLIWFLCIFANALITTIIKYNGIILGAIPSVLLFAGTMWLARTLCKKWDVYKEKKSAEKKGPAHTPLSDVLQINSEIHFCRVCGEKLVDNSQFCHKCGSPIAKKESPTISENKTPAATTPNAESTPTLTQYTDLSDEDVVEKMLTAGTYNIFDNSDSVSGSQSKRNPKTKKVAIILAAMCALICILVLAIGFGSRAYRYNKACSKLKTGHYQEAIAIFEKLDSYKQSEAKIIDAKYNQACSKLEAGRYQEAITIFEELDGYKLSEAKVYEAKYSYVLENRNNANATTFEYLKDLKKQDYKDSINIFKELYSWKITVFAINSSLNDEKTELKSISKYDPIYFHMELTGGEPNDTVRITVETIFPNGQVGTYQFEELCGAGDILWYGWADGIHENLRYGECGTLRCNFYDEDGKLIGAATTYITT